MDASLHSERKMMEFKLSRADFLHQTRHDIRSAMHVVIGMSKVLSMSDTLTPQQKEIVTTLKNNADRSMALIDNMFDFLQPDRESDRELPPVTDALPRKSEQEEDSRDREVLASAPDKKSSALLVDDSAASASVAGAFLEKLGYNYDVAKSGPEALNKFSTGRYDVIIMDVQMPGMDGLETARQIRAIEKNKNMAPTPILATTGNATEDDQLFCLKAGMNDFLSKPFELEDLEKKLRNVIMTTAKRGHGPFKFGEDACW